MMKHPVSIQVSDVGQPRRNADNTIQVNVLSQDTKIPLFKIQVQRHELARLLQLKMVGHLNQHRLEGYLVT